MENITPLKNAMTDNLDEINEKIKNKSPPTDKDKENLLHKLNKQLNEDEHLYLFTEILQTLEKRIYSITENCTLFDLNDLPHDAFWKIHYYTYLFIHDHERQKELEKAKQDNMANSDEFKEKMRMELANKIKDPNNALPENLNGLSAYEKLRINALSQCSYSTYAKDTNKSDYNLTLPDDKRMEKTIYSDNFKHRWKQDNKMTPTANNITITKKDIDVETQSVGAISVNDAGDDDDDDMMLNGDFDDEDPDKLDQEAEKAELDKFKNQLLKAPKMKLSLKVTPLNYEDDDDD